MYEDLEWTQLANAPFSPRADVLGRWWSPRFSTPTFLLQKAPFLYFIGGQTGHACGLRELGVCSNEIWAARLTLTISGNISEGDVRYQFGLRWNSTAVVLPFTPRCEAAVVTGPIAEFPRTTIGGYQRLLIMGGQLSYNISGSDCSSYPLTVNEVWAVNLNFSTGRLLLFARQAPAPWSPRRFSPSSNIEDPVLEGSTLPSMLMGGVRYSTVRALNASTARLTGVEVFGEIWQCGAAKVATGPATPQQCRWESAATARGSSVQIPFALLAVPAAGGGFAMTPQLTRAPFIGGFSSPTARRQWQFTRPYSSDDQVLSGMDVNWNEVPTNVTAVFSPTGGAIAALTLNRTLWNSYAWWEQLRSQLRLGLPTNTTLTEAELNDSNSDYQLGSDWVHSYLNQISHTIWEEEGIETLFGDYTASTLHPQPYAFVDHPDQSNWFCPTGGLLSHYMQTSAQLSTAAAPPSNHRHHRRPSRVRAAHAGRDLGREASDRIQCVQLDQWGPLGLNLQQRLVERLQCSLPPAYGSLVCVSAGTCALRSSPLSKGS